MSRIVLTRGLPASGKSTWARAWVDALPDKRARVNRDDIRFQLFGAYWGVDEQAVTKVEKAMALSILESGRDVVIDATHLRARKVRDWHLLGYDVTVQDFVVPLVDLVYRDNMRSKQGERAVGDKVILDMAKRYQIKNDGTLPPLPEPPQAPQWTPAPPYDFMLDDAIIVDIDGTVANHEGIRSPYDTTRYQFDTPHENVIDIVNALFSDGDDGRYMKVIFVSGRDAGFRAVTEEWLDKYVGIPQRQLFMRPQGDERNDAVVKHELYHQHIAGKYNVVGVFDDRGRVLRMWRAIGLTTFAVGDTDNYNF